MTLDRDPVTVEDALYKVVGELTMPGAIAATGRSSDYIYALTHPDRREILNVRDLELLDLAFHAKTGKGFPLFQALGRRLQTAHAERFADAAAIGDHAAELARESGQSVSALIDAALASGDVGRLREATRQTEDVHRVAGEILATLRGALTRSTVPPPDTS